MASKKLQTEVDRTLKKVSEGLTEYDDIWNRMEDAATLVQKEKLEAELKKKIKQLQRFRDSLKTWLGNDAVQDDDGLILKYKKDIENRMESFKKCERQTKTKAYSKEALASQLTRTELLTPEQKELKKWLEESKNQLEAQIEEMREQVDDFERKKTRKRKKGDDDEMNDLQNRIKTHRWHQKQLGLLWEKVRSGVCTVQLVQMIQDEMDYYVQEAWQDRDWPDNEFFYEVFDNLDEETGKLDGQTAEVYGITSAEAAAAAAAAAERGLYDESSSDMDPAATMASSAHSAAARRSTDDPAARGFFLKIKKNSKNRNKKYKKQYAAISCCRLRKPLMAASSIADVSK